MKTCNKRQLKTLPMSGDLGLLLHYNTVTQKALILCVSGLSGAPGRGEDEV